MTKDQLFEVVDLYNIVVSLFQRRLKEKHTVCSCGLVGGSAGATDYSVTSAADSARAYYEEQKVLLVYQRETEL